MRWIKASERLPEYDKRVNGKINGRPAIVKNSKLVKGYITVNGNLERVENVEWLDEQPSPPTRLRKESQCLKKLDGGEECKELCELCFQIYKENPSCHLLTDDRYYTKEFLKFIGKKNLYVDHDGSIWQDAYSGGKQISIDELLKEFSPSLTDEPDAGYWKKRCEAIEKVIEMSQSLGFARLEIYGEKTDEWSKYYHTWQQLKQTPAKDDKGDELGKVASELKSKHL